MSEHSRSGNDIAVEQDVRPCKHMENMVSGLADGSLHGPARWFTQIHILYCAPCRSAVKNLRTVIDKVADLRDGAAPGPARLPGDRRAELDRALDELDGPTPGKG